MDEEEEREEEQLPIGQLDTWVKVTLVTLVRFSYFGFFTLINNN